MKRWLIVAVAAVVAFIIGALFGSRYLVQPTRHEREVEWMASAQREQNNAETCVNVLGILEDHNSDAAKEFCAMQLAIYYKMFRDSDDAHAPGRRYLLNLIREDAEKWPDLKRAFDKWASPDTTPVQPK